MGGRCPDASAPGCGVAGNHTCGARTGRGQPPAWRFRLLMLRIQTPAPRGTVPRPCVPPARLPVRGAPGGGQQGTGRPGNGAVAEAVEPPQGRAPSPGCRQPPACPERPRTDALPSLLSSRSLPSSLLLGRPLPRPEHLKPEPRRRRGLCPLPLSRGAGQACRRPSADEGKGSRISSFQKPGGHRPLS